MWRALSIGYRFALCCLLLLYRQDGPVRDRSRGYQIMVEDLRLLGVYAPVLTPFTRDGAVDPRLFTGFCRWLNRAGVGLAVFGTNSEANSLTVDEKLALLEALRNGGIPGSALMPGTGALANRRCGAADQGGPRCRSGGGAGAAALLLQAGRRGRALCLLQRARAAGRQPRAAGRALSHSPPLRGADHAGPRRAAAQGLSGDLRRHRGTRERHRPHG